MEQNLLGSRTNVTNNAATTKEGAEMYKYPKHSLSFPAEDFLQKPNRTAFTRCQKEDK